MFMYEEETIMSKTKMTVGQAVVKFLNQQYIEFDGVEQPFVDGIFTIFGHGMVVGLGQALDEDPGRLRVYQGETSRAWHMLLSLMRSSTTAARSSLALLPSALAQQTW